MKTLNVRSIPDELYRRLERLARARNRSLSAQVIKMLEQALEKEPRQDQEKVVVSIRRRRFSSPAKLPSSTDLLREDRNR